MKGNMPKCALCGWEISEEEAKKYNNLCWQCWVGEIENPEHRVWVV